MAIACVQKTNQGSCIGVGAPISGAAVTSITVTLPANVTAGNAIIIMLSTGGTNNALSFATGMGITSANWAQAVEKNWAAGSSAYIWYGLNSTGGSASVLVTTPMDDIAGEAVEFSGMATSGALDV